MNNDQAARVARIERAYARESLIKAGICPACKQAMTEKEINGSVFAYPCKHLLRLFVCRR